MRFGPLRPIEDEVRRELARFGPVAGLGDIVDAWPECVGAGIAGNAWPGRMAFELTQLATSILERLQERLGEKAPASLRFAPGPLPEAGLEPVEASKRTVPKASEADRAEGARIAATIENPDLRKAVARAAEASLAAGTNRSI